MVKDSWQELNPLHKELILIVGIVGMERNANVINLDNVKSIITNK